MCQNQTYQIHWPKAQRSIPSTSPVSIHLHVPIHLHHIYYSLYSKLHNKHPSRLYTLDNDVLISTSMSTIHSHKLSYYITYTICHCPWKPEAICLCVQTYLSNKADSDSELSPYFTIRFTSQCQRSEALHITSQTCNWRHK